MIKNGEYKLSMEHRMTAVEAALSLIKKVCIAVLVLLIGHAIMAAISMTLSVINK